MDDDVTDARIAKDGFCDGLELDGGGGGGGLIAIGTILGDEKSHVADALIDGQFRGVFLVVGSEIQCNGHAAGSRNQRNGTARFCC